MRWATSDWLRNVLLVTIIAFSCAQAFAQKKWDGEGGDGLWENSLNWTNNSLPLSTDDVVLDNSFITASYDINIAGTSGAVSCRSIMISPASSNSINLIIPSTNLQRLALSTLGPGYSIVINNGGILTNASGASSGTILSIVDSLKINNGGKYIHKTQRGNAAILNTLSSAIGTEKGIVEFDVKVSGSYIVSLTNRTFGTLIFSAVTNNAPITYTSNANNGVLIRGDLQINPLVTLSVGFNDTIDVIGNFSHDGNLLNLSNNGNATVLQLRGNAHSSPTSTITETNIAKPVILLAGTGIQSLQLQGPVTNEIVLKLEKSSTAILTSPLILPYQLELKKGILKTDQRNLLTLAATAEIVVDSTKIDQSFIDGPMKKLGLFKRDHFICPIGKENKMRWVELRNATGDFTLEYFKGNPYALGTIMNGVDHISRIEYWTIEADAGSSGRIELSFDNVNSGGVTDVASLRVAQLTTSWINQGNTGTTGSAGAAGSVVSGPINSFSLTDKNFSLASVASNENPLPLRWILLNVRDMNKDVELQWKIPQGWKPKEFKIEFSPDGIRFNPVGRIVFEESRYSYLYRITSVLPGNRWYRIAGVEWDGEEIQSKAFATTGGVPELFIWCNNLLFARKLNVWINSKKSMNLNLTLVDVSGKQYWREMIYLHAGVQEVKSILPMLNSGLYYLFASNGIVRSNTVAIVVNEW